MQAKPSALIYLWEPKNGSITLHFGARSLGGDLHPTSIAVHAPSDKLLHHIPRVPENGGPSRWEGGRRLESDN